MDALFGSDLWKPALDKYAEATGLSVELFGEDARVVLASTYSTPLVGLFREYGFEPGLFAECARRCLRQSYPRPVVTADPSFGLTVVGSSLMLDRKVVGVAVAGYALDQFSQVAVVQHWAKATHVPFYRLWDVVRRLPPVPERRLLLHGELLKILGDALLRENLRTRQYEDAVVQLRQASSAKDEFLAVLSHELRTPLAPIAGWASVLRKSRNLEQVQRAAAAIERNALLQARMIDDLLDVTRIAHGSIALELEILDLSACVRAALETVTQEIEKKSIRVEIAEAAGPLLVEGDPGRVQQIFRNVLSNAVKFTPAGGSIRISLGGEARNVSVVFADSGKGIAPEFLPFVFEIFRQQENGTRREYKGLGIGLALVKKLTELHKGTVGVTSAGTGRGTEVTVTLPRAAETRDAREPPEAGDDEAEASDGSIFPGLAVLVVDDVQDARETLQALLQQLGAEVTIARGGQEALDLIRDEVPDLVLCDLRMPHMDGFEFIEALERSYPQGHPPVVAVSALASEADRQRAREAGFVGHLKKPFDEAALAAAVDAALTRAPASKSSSFSRPPPSRN